MDRAPSISPGWVVRQIRAVHPFGWWIWVATFLLLAPGAPRSEAASGQWEEIQVRAAYLYNFTQFVEWPEQSFASPSEPLTIGVLGPESQVKELAPLLEGRRIGRRPILVRQLKEPLDGRSCHVVLITENANDRSEEAAATFRGQAILTIGNGESFARAGGIIGLYISEDRLRFSINHHAALENGLRISAQLLSLARLVESDVRQ